jgi:hypothetical protein
MSCFPVPWVYHQWPDFAGIIARGDKPTADAKIRYSTDRKAVDCNPAPDEIIPPKENQAFHYYSEEVTSSGNGEFLFPGRQSFFVSGILFPELQNVSHIGIFASKRATVSDSRKRSPSVGEGWGLYRTRHRIL